jgi:hypothetical protein
MGAGNADLENTPCHFITHDYLKKQRKQEIERD